MNVIMQDKRSSFARYIWLTLILYVLLAVFFAIYVSLERQIDRANDLRHQTFLLADELRQSSDDLTRMVRTYVETGDPVYKQYYQDILDIRNGKKPRPSGYQNIYWDFVVANRPPHLGSGPAIALLELMRQAGFTQQEFRKLAEAKANSDKLTAREYEAMQLVETTGPGAEANHARARLMMYDDNYHQAKSAIMKPISDFLLLMDKRTFGAVQAAKTTATIFRVVFIALGLSLIGMLFKTNKILRTIMGGAVDEVYESITRIGGGDFSSAITITDDMKNSILEKLAGMQTRLREIDAERKKTEAVLRKSEERYRGLFESSREAIMILESPSWKFVSGNPATKEMFRVKNEDEFASLGPWSLSPEKQPDGRASAEKSKEMIETAMRQGFCFFEWTHKRIDGEEFPATVLLTRMKLGEDVAIQATVRDITRQKQAEEELKQKVAELERFNKIAVDRELRMIELKEKLRALEQGKT